MSNHKTFVQYESGRTEIIHHKNDSDKKQMRKMLSVMNTVINYRDPTPDDLRGRK